MMLCGGGESTAVFAFFGAGTGGHIMPGIALAEAIQRRVPGARPVFFTSGRPVESRILEGYPFENHGMPFTAPGPSPLRFARFLWGLAWGFPRVVLWMRRKRPVVAVGLGGYGSVAGIISARLLGVPVMLLEQNRVPGRANRILARWAEAVCLAWDESKPFFPTHVVRWTGNPVREMVLEAARMRRRRIRRQPTLFIVGGSQGARGLNRAAVGAAPRWSNYRDRFRVVHLTGPADRGEVERAYKDCGIHGEVHDFLPDLPLRLRDADLVLARAGGTSIAEFAVLGIPSVLVPYPYHRDHHQRANAEGAVAAGASQLIEERGLTPERLEEIVRDVLLRPDRLDVMSRGASRLAHPRAAEEVVDIALGLRQGNPSRS